MVLNNFHALIPKISMLNSPQHTVHVILSVLRIVCDLMHNKNIYDLIT